MKKTNFREQHGIGRVRGSRRSKKTWNRFLAHISKPDQITKIQSNRKRKQERIEKNHLERSLEEKKSRLDLAK
jgi:hypothetical protein